MCDEGGEPADVWRESWRKACKTHRCCACNETIAAGHRYHFVSGICDGYPFTLKHCVRRWSIYEALGKRMPRSSIAPELDCGQVWRNPPPDVAALAFALPSDFAGAP